MKVFLGGTCSGYDWRNKLIPMLKCDYYNPVVEDWTEADRLREVRERETSDIVLYTITSDIKGVYSIAEVVDDSNKRPDRVILCNLYREEDDEQMYRSLVAVEKLVKHNGGQIFNSLEDVADYLGRIEWRILVNGK